jgi:hypothetical protein
VDRQKRSQGPVWHVSILILTRITDLWYAHHGFLEQ